VALLPLGALVGSFLATFPLNYLGRKPTVMLSGNNFPWLKSTQLKCNLTLIVAELNFAKQLIITLFSGK
jgi:hypothetical protein